MAEPSYVDASAAFDASGAYRYELLRRWAPGPTCLWIMLNPSTADATKLDPTLRRCLGFTRSWETGNPRDPGEGFGAFEVCNLYAYRSPHPRDLWYERKIVRDDGCWTIHRPPDDPVGPNNDAAIQSAAKRASLVIVGWGVNAKPERERHVAQLLADVGVQPHALRVAKNGSPSHPLYLPETMRPFRWHAKGIR